MHCEVIFKLARVIMLLSLEMSFNICLYQEVYHLLQFQLITKKITTKATEAYINYTK